VTHVEVGHGCRSAATAGEITAAEALNGVIGASREYRLVFSSARAA
jgi:hypothetical protein